MEALKKLLHTDSNDYVQLILRLTLGIMMFPHGAQKLFGWFGGYGFEGTYGYFTGQGLPGVIAFLVIIGESLGSVAILIGLMTRFSAASIGVIMLGAALLVHWPHGLLGSDQGTGFELHLLAIGIAIALSIRGGGMASLDAMISGALSRKS